MERAVTYLGFYTGTCKKGLIKHEQVKPVDTDRDLNHISTEFEQRLLLIGQFVSLKLQGVSRLVNITAGGDFLGFSDQKCSYKHVSDFGRLRSYGHILIPVHALV